MDPNAVWKSLCEHLRVLRKNLQDAEAREQATECLSTLYNWLDRGGFPPDVLKAAAQMVAQEVLNNPMFQEKAE